MRIYNFWSFEQIRGERGRSHAAQAVTPSEEPPGSLPRASQGPDAPWLPVLTARASLLDFTHARPCRLQTKTAFQQLPAPDPVRFLCSGGCAHSGLQHQAERGRGERLPVSFPPGGNASCASRLTAASAGRCRNAPYPVKDVPVPSWVAKSVCRVQMLGCVR